MASIEYHVAIGVIQQALARQAETAMEIVGSMAETYAKLNAPVVTSNLKNSITHITQQTTVYIGTDVEYAPFVELGHLQQVGRYVPAIGKRLVRRFVPGKPFLKPAIEEHIEEFKEVIRSELSNTSDTFSGNPIATQNTKISQAHD